MGQVIRHRHRLFRELNDLEAPFERPFIQLLRLGKAGKSTDTENQHEMNVFYETVTISLNSYNRG